MSENLIISVIGMGIALITLLALFWQTRRQTKVDSARFTIDYIDKILEKNKDTVDIVLKREKDETAEFESDRSVRVLLNGLENIVQFVNDKTIRKEHMLNDLRIILEAIKKDPTVQKIIKNEQLEHKTTYELIVKFLDDEID